MDSDAYDILTTDDESTTEIVDIDRAEIKDAISCLANNHWHDPKKLPSNHRVAKSYNLIKLVVSLAEEEEMKKIGSIISKQYRPIRVSPGTVGAFLFGCSQRDYGEAEKECSPLCLSNIGHGYCQHQVWDMRGLLPNRYVRVNTPEEDNGSAYVYCREKFEGFTKEELSDLKEAGVKTLQVYTTNDNGHRLEIPMTDISGMSSETKVKKGTSDAGEPDDNNYGYLITIALAVVVMVLLFLIS